MRVPKVDQLVNSVQESLQLSKEDGEDWDHHQDINRKTLAVWVGFVAFGLPFAMLLFGVGECFRDSISHYYYDDVAGTIFVGMLFFIGAFLFAYHSVPWVTRLSTVAGILAFLVAILPTTGSGCESSAFRGRPFSNISTDADGLVIWTSAQEFQMFSAASLLHFISATFLFSVLAFFCFVIFTRKLDKHYDKDGNLKPEKARRNKVYIACGILMVLAIGTIGLKISPLGASWAFWDRYNLTFWMEAAALWSFGVSWTIKGRLGWLNNTMLGKLVIDPDDRPPANNLTQP